MRAAGLGYHFPLLFGDDTKKYGHCARQGLGLLGNLPGDEKRCRLLNTAVDVNDLPDFVPKLTKY